MQAWLAIAIGVAPFVLILAGVALVARRRRRAGFVMAGCGVGLAAVLWIGVVVMGGRP